MKLVTLVFLATLFYAHSLDNAAEAFDQPLSMFRDGEHATFGYALFALLLTAGGLMTVTLARAGRGGGACVYGSAAVLLALVAVTPSLDELHVLCSFVLLLVLYVYHATLLYQRGSAWLWAHLAVPTLLLLATGCHSYGLWQKSLIVYLVLAVGLHHHALSAWLRRTAERADVPAVLAFRPRRRQVACVLADDRAWFKRRSA
jgi:hypothetical protein